MTVVSVVTDAVPKTLTQALESLTVACKDLDAAVLALPNAPGDDFMASPNLVALLFRVVMARRHVNRIEQLRISTVS